MNAYVLFLQLLEGEQIENPRQSVRGLYYKWLADAASPEQEEADDETERR